MKKIKSILISSLTGFLIAYLIFSIYQIFMAFEFRKDPKRENLSYYYDSNLPHSYLPKKIIYKKGIDNYNEDLLSLSRKLKNISTSDCLMLTRIADEVNVKYFLALEDEVYEGYPKCLSRHIASKIISPEVIESQENLSSVSNVLLEDVLCVNSISADRIIRKKLIEEKRSDLFFKLLIPVVKCKNTQLNTLVEKYIYEIEHKNNADEIFRDIAINLSVDNLNQLKLIFENENLQISNFSKKYMLYSIVDKTDDLEDESVINKIKKMSSVKILRDSHILISMKSKVDRSLTEMIKRINLIKKYDNYFASLLAHNLIHESILTSEVFADELSEKKYPQKNINYIVDSDIYDKKMLFKKEMLKKYYSGEGLVLVEFIKAQLKEKPISEFGKNLLVLLSRHSKNIPFEIEYFDEVFLGKSPRSMLFLGISQYSSGSAVIQEYEKIVEHGYANAEINWPLEKYRDSGVENLKMKINLWNSFIKKYPTHPSVDDAYLRLAFDLFNTNSFDDGINVIENYFRNNNRPDRSAESILRSLYFHFLMASNSSNLTEANILLKELYSLPTCVEEINCELISSSEVKKILRNELLLDISILNNKQLRKLILLVDNEKSKILEIVKKDSYIYNIFFDLANNNAQDKYYGPIHDDNDVFSSFVNGNLSLLPIYGNRTKHFNESHLKYPNRKEEW